MNGFTDDLHISKNGKYYAQTLKATLKYPTGKNKPYGLFILDKNGYKSEVIMDLSAFRPDIKDYIKGNNFVAIIVLYEKTKYTDDDSMFPRYILYEGVLFTNVRNSQKGAPVRKKF